MAATRNSQPNFISQLLIILVIISNNAPRSFSQSDSPQNIQTFYPASPSPPPPTPVDPPPPPPPPPPPTDQQPTAANPPPRGSSTRAAVGKAIGLTAAGTAALSGLLFFLLLRRSRRIRSSEEENNAAASPGPPPAAAGDDFSRFSGNIKGLIVDENGLDVLYWKTQHENRASFKKEYYNREKASGGGSKSGRPAVQEIPLLRGKSSTSHSPVWADPNWEDSPSIWTNNAPSPPPNKRSFSLGVGTSRSKGGPTNPNSADQYSKFDGDLMEALFGTIATNRKFPQIDNNRQSPSPRSPGPRSEIFILDTRKSQAVSTVLKSLGLTRKEIVDSLNEGHGLNLDTIEKFTTISLSEKETARITSFDGDPTRLAEAESFLYHLLKSVPSAFTRFNAMLFRSTYTSEVSTVKQSLNSLELACDELKTRGLFLKLLDAVLKAGTRLSAGPPQTFNLTALRKLSEVKSSDGKTTLLEFVVQEVVRAEGKRSGLSRTSSRNGSQSSASEQEKADREMEYMSLGLPVFGGLSTEFSNVRKAAEVDYEVMVKSIRALSSKATETRGLVLRCERGSRFVREMNGFLDKVEIEIGGLRDEEGRVMELVTKTREHYQAGSLRENRPNDVFVIVRDFLGMVDRVCADIATSVRSRRSLSSSSTLDSPRVFRFPKLPANFMSENSTSGSGDG